MFAGPNGSGKTTVQREIARPFPSDFLGVLVNPDDIERDNCTLRPTRSWPVQRQRHRARSLGCLDVFSLSETTSTCGCGRRTSVRRPNHRLFRADDELVLRLCPGRLPPPQIAGRFHAVYVRNGDVRTRKNRFAERGGEEFWLPNLPLLRCHRRPRNQYLAAWRFASPKAVTMCRRPRSFRGIIARLVWCAMPSGTRIELISSTQVKRCLSIHRGEYERQASSAAIPPNAKLVQDICLG